MITAKKCPDGDVEGSGLLDRIDRSSPVVENDSKSKGTKTNSKPKKINEGSDNIKRSKMSKAVAQKSKVTVKGKSREKKTVGEMCRGMRRKLYVGMDVHKKEIQVAVMTASGDTIVNTGIPGDFDTIRNELKYMPPSAEYVMESSSVSKGRYRFMTRQLGLDTVVSNPLRTHMISKSKKKTDANDAVILADLLRGGHLSLCYVPGIKTENERDVVRYRDYQVNAKVVAKQKIKAILNQNATVLKGDWTSPYYKKQLRMLDDWRIDSLLRTIDFANGQIDVADKKIKTCMESNSDARLLTTMPGIGNVIGLALASEIDGIERFKSPEKLKAYFGMVPSVHNSADSVKHGHITRAGSSLIRKLLVQATLSHLAWQPDSPITMCYKRLAEKKPGRVALVAAANKMTVYVFWMLKRRMGFGELIERGRRLQKGKRE